MPQANLKKLVLAAGLASGLASTGASAATLELALLIDGSGSIAPSDFDLQIDAYESIFENDFFTNFVAPSPDFTAVAVSAWQFGTNVNQEIGWTVIDSDAAADTFAAGFSGIVQDEGLTNTQQAIDTARESIFSNGIDGDAFVIDISTDGEPTATGDPGTDACFFAGTCDDQAIAAADAARALGVVVNAIGVGGINAAFLADLVDGTPDGFFVTADTFADFADTLETKIGRETGVIPDPVPGPASLALMALGAVGLGAARRARS